MFLFYCTVCQNLYNRLCSLWDDYCQPEAYRFVRENIIDRYRYSCPITCGKCSSGQKMLDVSIYSKQIISQTPVLHPLEKMLLRIIKSFICVRVIDSFSPQKAKTEVLSQSAKQNKMVQLMIYCAVRAQSLLIFILSSSNVFGIFTDKCMFVCFHRKTLKYPEVHRRLTEEVHITWKNKCIDS